MTVFAICGPIGSAIRVTANELAEKGDMVLIDEADYLSANHVLNADALLQAISQAEGHVVVCGHFILTDESIRANIKFKLFLDTEPEDCLLTYLKNKPYDAGLKSYKNQYEQVIKPLNQDVIMPSKKHADMYLVNTANSIELLLLVAQKEEFDARHNGGNVRNPQSFFNIAKDPKAPTQPQSLPGYLTMS